MLHTIKEFLTGKREITNRIRDRHTRFWSAPDARSFSSALLENVTTLNEWKNVNYWQRRLSNKFNSREFVQLLGCKVPELYWKGIKPSTIDFANLPQNYVIRPTTGHSSKMIFLMKNGLNLFDNIRYTEEEIKLELAKLLYENPSIHFLVEEFLSDEEGVCKIQNDYKFYMFNGRVACIHLINRLSPKKGFQGFYSENWEQLDCVNDYYEDIPFQKAPACLPEMIRHAKTLSQAYEIFVRIDFYATDKGAVFGEFSPTPHLGGNFTNYGDKLLTSYWDNYCRGMI